MVATTICSKMGKGNSKTKSRRKATWYEVDNLFSCCLSMSTIACLTAGRCHWVSELKAPLGRCPRRGFPGFPNGPTRIPFFPNYITMTLQTFYLVKYSFRFFRTTCSWAFLETLLLSSYAMFKGSVFSKLHVFRFFRTICLVRKKRNKAVLPRPPHQWQQNPKNRNSDNGEPPVVRNKRTAPTTLRYCYYRVTSFPNQN